MRDTPPHLKSLQEIEKTCIPGLVEVLREEGIDAVRYVLWDATGDGSAYGEAVSPCLVIFGQFL